MFTQNCAVNAEGVPSGRVQVHSTYNLNLKTLSAIDQNQIVEEKKRRRKNSMRKSVSCVRKPELVEINVYLRSSSNNNKVKRRKGIGEDRDERKKECKCKAISVYKRQKRRRQNVIFRFPTMPKERLKESSTTTKASQQHLYIGFSLTTHCHIVYMISPFAITFLLRCVQQTKRSRKKRWSRNSHIILIMIMDFFFVFFLSFFPFAAHFSSRLFVLVFSALCCGVSLVHKFQIYIIICDHFCKST